MNVLTRSSIRDCLGCLVAGGLAISLAACGTDSEGRAAAPRSTAPSLATTVPAGTVAPTVPAAPVTVATSSAPGMSSPESTVPVEPVPVRDEMFLTAGWPYASGNISVPFTFSIPSDDVLGRWRLLFDTSNYLIITLSIDDKAEPTVRREEPGVVFFALPEGVTSDEFVALWATYAAEQESFTVDVSQGAYLDTEATVVSGTYDLGDPGRGAYLIRLGDSMTVPVASGERSYLAYLIPVGDRNVMVQVNAHDLDFDLNVTLVNQIIESVEFV